MGERPVSPWRAGQAAWNAAHAAYPDLVEPLRGGDLDPFHHDDRVPAFVAEVERLSVRARESTSAPWWVIIQPAPNGSTRSVAAAITGPFRSREAAYDELRERGYAYSPKSVVWCLSGERAARRERTASPDAAPHRPATETTERDNAKLRRKVVALELALNTANAHVMRLSDWLVRIEGGDAPCEDAEQLRRWAYEAVTLGREVSDG